MPIRHPMGMKKLHATHVTFCQPTTLDTGYPNLHGLSAKAPASPTPSDTEGVSIHGVPSCSHKRRGGSLEAGERAIPPTLLFAYAVWPCGAIDVGFERRPCGASTRISGDGKTIVAGVRTTCGMSQAQPCCGSTRQRQRSINPGASSGQTPQSAKRLRSGLPESTWSSPGQARLERAPSPGIRLRLGFDWLDWPAGAKAAHRFAAVTALRHDDLDYSRCGTTVGFPSCTPDGFERAFAPTPSGDRCAALDLPALPEPPSLRSQLPALIHCLFPPTG